MDKFSDLRNPIRNAEDGRTIIDLEEENIASGEMVFKSISSNK